MAANLIGCYSSKSLDNLLFESKYKQQNMELLYLSEEERSELSRSFEQILIISTSDRSYGYFGSRYGAEIEWSVYLCGLNPANSKIYVYGPAQIYRKHHLL